MLSPAATVAASTTTLKAAGDPLHDLGAIKERVRDQVDLVALVEEHTTLKRQGRNFIGLCPFHQEKTPSFTVNPERQFFKCFGCNAGGDVFTFVQLRESVDFREALRMLADRAGIELIASPCQPPGQSSRADIARANAWAREFYHKVLLDSQLGKSAREYLASRGINPEMVAQFCIGLAIGEGNPLLRAAGRAGFDSRLLVDAGLCRTGDRGATYDTFRDRLMFPICDATGRCIGFGGRTLVEDKAKYMNTPQTALFDKSKSLFGIDLARKPVEREGVAVVVEGYTDCIAAHQHGFTHTVAALGTAATESHMAQLRRYCGSVILVFDSDAAGDAAADRALAVALGQNLRVKLARVPGAKDPCDFLQNSGAQGFTSLLNSALDALVFKWNRTRSRYLETDSAAVRRDAASDFVSLVAELSGFGLLDAIQQGIVIGQLANLLSVSPEQVRKLIADRTQRGRRRATGNDHSTVETRPPRDAEQAALETMLEVLVNEPGLFDTVADQFDPQRFADATRRKIAGHLRDLVRRVGEFRFSELQSCVHEPHEAELLTDLAIRGAQVGNFAATLAGASRRLAEVDALRETARLAEELKRGQSDGQPLNEEGVRARLGEVGRRLASGSHFAPGRAIKERVGPGAAATEAPERVGRQE